MEATKTAAPATEQTKKKKKKVSPYMVFSTIVIILLAIAFAFPAVLDHHRLLQDAGVHQRHHARMVAQ